MEKAWLLSVTPPTSFRGHAGVLDHLVRFQVVLLIEGVQDGHQPIHGGQVDAEVSVHAAGEGALQLVAFGRHQGSREALIGRSGSQRQLEGTGGGCVCVRNITPKHFRVFIWVLPQRLPGRPIRDTDEESCRKRDLKKRTITASNSLLAT